MEHVLMSILGYRLIPERCPHAEGRELLREAAARRCPRASGQGPPRPLPEGLLRQERFRHAYVDLETDDTGPINTWMDEMLTSLHSPCPRYWSPHCHWLRTELLLPLA